MEWVLRHWRALLIGVLLVVYVVDRFVDTSRSYPWGLFALVGSLSIGLASRWGDRRAGHGPADDRRVAEGLGGSSRPGG